MRLIKIEPICNLAAFAAGACGILCPHIGLPCGAFLLSLVGGAFPFLVISSSTEQIVNGQRVTTGAGGSILVSLIYFVIFWSHLGGGRTLGMRLLRLRVIREDGSELGVVGAAIRWLGLWLSIGLCFIGVIWVAFDSRHQGWHDKIAKTLVVHS